VRSEDGDAQSYFPDWLLTPRRRAEQAFVSVIADAYLAGLVLRLRLERRAAPLDDVTARKLLHHDLLL